MFRSRPSRAGGGHNDHGGNDGGAGGGQHDEGGVGGRDPQEEIDRQRREAQERMDNMARIREDNDRRRRNDDARRRGVDRGPIDGRKSLNLDNIRPIPNVPPVAGRGGVGADNSAARAQQELIDKMRSDAAARKAAAERVRNQQTAGNDAAPPPRRPLFEIDTNAPANIQAQLEALDARIAEREADEIALRAQLDAEQLKIHDRENKLKEEMEARDIKEALQRIQNQAEIAG